MVGKWDGRKMNGTRMFWANGVYAIRVRMSLTGVSVRERAWATEVVLYIPRRTRMHLGILILWSLVKANGA